MGKEWEEKLFGCFSNIPVCLVTVLLPGGLCFVQSAAVNTITKEGAAVPYLLVCCLGAIGGAINRETIRKRLSIEGSIVGSCAVWCCCPACAACQEYRESKGHSHHHH